MRFPLHAAALRRTPLAAAVLLTCTLAAHAQSTTEVQEISVRDRTGSANYQGTRRNTAATRTDTPLIETPQAVRVVPRQLLNDLGANRLSDAVDFVSGVSRLNDFGGNWDNYAIRGFSNTDGGSLLNGFASGRGYGPQRDAATIERVEFLKGPAAALYGSSEPGGTLNVVTKKPQFTPSHTVGLQAGTLGYRRATLDSTGPLAQNVAYRLNLVTEDGASRTSVVDNRKSVLAPALTWSIDANTVLQYEAEFIRIRAPLDRGIVQVNGDPGVVSRDTYLGDPSRGNMHIHGDTHQITLDRDLGQGWRTRIGASSRETEFYGDAIDLLGTLRSDQRTLTRRDSTRSLPSRDQSIQAEVEGRLDVGGMRHTILAGLESWRVLMKQGIRYSNLTAEPFAIDIYNPVYNQPQGTLTPGFDTEDRQRATGVFLQDQVDLTEKWKLLAGVRFDRFKQDYTDKLANLHRVQAHSVASPRLGITYLIDANRSVYASAGRSFRPNAGAGQNGEAFDPTSGKALEAGAKWQSADQQLSGSVALFHIVKSNVLTRDPTNASYNVAAGEVRSQGLEADFAGKLDAKWRMTANFAYTDAEVTRDNNAALVGKRLLNIPRVSGGLFAIREDVLPSSLGRYGVGSGLVHVGERTGTALDTYRLPAYTTVRVTSYWQIDPRTRLTLDVHNLFDETYYRASWGNLTVLPGLGRQIVAGLQTTF